MKIKDYFFSAFREIFIYHHNSLEFRAKLFALLIAANGEADECAMNLVQNAGMEIYNDESRAKALTLATREFTEKVLERNGLDIDLLVHDIIEDVKIYPRYVKKINTVKLRRILECTRDEDTRLYQERMLEFLESLCEEHGERVLV